CDPSPCFSTKSARNLKSSTISCCPKAIFPVTLKDSALVVCPTKSYPFSTASKETPSRPQKKSCMNQERLNSPSVIVLIPKFICFFTNFSISASSTLRSASSVISLFACATRAFLISVVLKKTSDVIMVTNINHLFCLLYVAVNYVLFDIYFYNYLKTHS